MKRQDIYKFVKPNSFHIWTDGSYRPEGNAACAYLIFSEEEQRVVHRSSFVSRGSTINQMELKAIGLALEYPGMENVIIYSDSAYAISCLTIWRKMWIHKDWKTPLGEPVKNRELIESIGKRIDELSVKFVKVQAHAGDYFNSVVDSMASGLTKSMVSDGSIKDGIYTV
jgi:ribonuclease HI